MIRRFAIHDILTFEIVDRRPKTFRSILNLLKLNRYLLNRYRAFSIPTEDGKNPELTIELGSFEPSLSNCNVLDDEIYVKPNYVYLRRERHKLGGWLSFDALGFEEGNCRVRVESNLAGTPLIPGRVIDFFIHYMMAKHGCPLLHASGVAKGESAMIFSGRGGSGKTTIAIELVLKEDWAYLGDNFIGVRDGRAFSFFSDLNLFEYNLRPEIWTNLSRAERLRHKLNVAVHHLTLGYIKMFTTLSPSSVFPRSMQASARIGNLCLLIPGKKLSVSRSERRESISRLVSNQKLEFLPFVRLADLYGCVVRNSHFANWCQEYENAVRSNLPRRAEYFTVTVPQQITPIHVASILRSVASLENE